MNGLSFGIRTISGFGFVECPGLVWRSVLQNERAQKRPLFRVAFFDVWLREPDLNRRPSGYEPDELPDCSIPRLCWQFYRNTPGCQPAISIKPVPVQSLSCRWWCAGGLRGRHGKGCGSIGGLFSIEKINFSQVSYE